VAVAGGAEASERDRREARALGAALARGGAVVVCGGAGGVMEAVAAGAAEEGGWVVGILPGSDADEANRWITIPLPTGLGAARNALVALAGEAMVAVGGSWGTLSEIALAGVAGIPVGLVGDPPAEGLDLPHLPDGETAAAWALARARERRARRHGLDDAG